jgi:hypothetical protein
MGTLGMNIRKRREELGMTQLVAIFNYVGKMWAKSQDI